MIISGYLVFSRKGVTRCTHRKPSKLIAGECVVRIMLDVPESVFTPEIATVKVHVPEHTVVKPEIKVIDNRTIPA